MKKWREELFLMMSSAGYRRRPALRRSIRDDYLLATDFPQAADEQSVLSFLETARGNGWQADLSDGWIELSRTMDFNDAIDTPVFRHPEADCCLSLLIRHQEKKESSDGRTEKTIAKAMEEGYSAYADACENIHALWAESLRISSSIPDVDIRYFGGESIC